MERSNSQSFCGTLFPPRGPGSRRRHSKDVVREESPTGGVSSLHCPYSRSSHTLCQTEGEPQVICKQLIYLLIYSYLTLCEIFNGTVVLVYLRHVFLKVSKLKALRCSTTVVPVLGSPGGDLPPPLSPPRLRCRPPSPAPKRLSKDSYPKDPPSRRGRFRDSILTRRRKRPSSHYTDLVPDSLTSTDVRNSTR